MKIKGLTKIQLEKRLNYLKETNPTSRWIKYIMYHLDIINEKNRLGRIIKLV